jgi:hypothetical protein
VSREMRAASCKPQPIARMTLSPLSCYSDGARRVWRAPVVWIGAWAFTLLAGVPLAMTVRDAIAVHLDSSLVAESVADGVNWDWWQEFQDQATGLGATFEPAILGFAAVMRHTSDLMDGMAPALPLATALAAWLVAWSFLSGGIIDRYARNRHTWTSGFFAACGTHGFRFLRLGVIALLAYLILFGWVHPLLHRTVWQQVMRSVMEERWAAAGAAVLYIVFGALLVAVSLVFDYARVRIVVEDRRSAIGAIAASIRFLRRHPRTIASVYVLNAAGWFMLAAVYALAAPGVHGGGALLWVAFLTGQAWIAARVWVKLTFYASAVSVFQRALAHADYVATAIPEWPESPAAEAVRAEPPVATAP